LDNQKPIVSSPYFLISTTIGLACLAVIAYTFVEYQKLLAPRSLLYFLIAAFFQIPYVWIRALKLQSQFAEAFKAEAAAKEKVQALAVRSVFEILLLSLSVAFLVLFYALLLCRDLSTK
jgi:hypothetical protein